MVESVEVSTPLCRDFVPELLKVVAQGGDEGGVSWNVVESLELLLDAGAFKDALALANGVVSMLGDDRRNRLFMMYADLCLLVQGASIKTSLEKIEAMAVEIENGGFSENDKAWSGVILARAILVGVYTRALPESEMLRARAILSGLFESGAEATNSQIHLKIGVDLARSYIQCPIPELPAARELLERLRTLAIDPGVSRETAFDVLRLMHQVGGENSCSVEQLRSNALPLGGVARGLAEISIVRREGRLTESGSEALEKAIALFDEAAYRSGEFEALVSLASASSECEHHAKAYRLFSRADKSAREGGFLYGRGVALLGVFHSSISSGEVEDAEIAAEKLRLLCSSDIFLAAFGLNIVAAHQLLGKYDIAIKLGAKCERLFVSQGAHALAGQAAFMVGASHAAVEKWKLARSAWKRALVCDELRRAHVSACDRRAAVAQAIAMVDFTEHGDLQEATLREVRDLLAKSEAALLPYGRAADASQSLGKTLHIHAQLEILAKRPLEALKHLNRARECYGNLGLEREVALTDGLTGLALLEASKQNGPQLLDESMSTLQRALDYFVRVEQMRVTWKLRYYLAVACILRSQQFSDPGYRQSYRQMAGGLLEEASRECGLLAIERGMPRAASGEGDFSPGLKPEVLEPLKQVLGLGPRKAKAKGKGEKESKPKKAPGYGPYLH